LYLLRAKKFTIKKLIILLASGLAVYGLAHSMWKGETVGLGRFITIFNTLLLFALGAYTLTGFFALGSRIERKWLHFTQHRRQEVLLTLGIGTITFLVIVQILLGIGILYGIVSRLLFLGL
jgi:branched-subunit amino acid transport protein AzlD